MTDTEPRAYTPDEVQGMLLDHIWNLIDYWNDLDTERDRRERMSGLAFSILSMLDGCSMGLPGFLVTPIPHSSDKEYHRDEGQNWFPEDKPDLGMLHEAFGSRDPKRK